MADVTNRAGSDGGIILSPSAQVLVMRLGLVRLGAVGKQLANAGPQTKAEVVSLVASMDFAVDATSDLGAHDRVVRLVRMANVATVFALLRMNFGAKIINVAAPGERSQQKGNDGQKTGHLSIAVVIDG